MLGAGRFGEITCNAILAMQQRSDPPAVRSQYRLYPFVEDTHDAEGENGPRVVRGGSFHDRPQRCRASFRLSYPAWQRVHNVGFRVVCEARDRVGG